jgi:hypothetical protein
MTQVATTLRSAYLAGPMRGIEEYNFPEFRKQTAWLRGMGWKVFSPAERDEQDETIDHTLDVAGWQGTRGLDYFMAYDLKAVCEMDAVICLPGWERSQGARLETVTAVEVEHPVFVISYAHGTGTRILRSVDPEYIQAVFAERGPIEGWERDPIPVDPWVQDFLAFKREDMKVDPLGCGHGPTVAEDRAAMAILPDWSPATGEVDSALPTGSQARKDVPLAMGVLDYFPAALVEVARVSKAGNDKHNPGQPLHHARGKSTDHADSLLRHLVDRGKVDHETGQRHSAEVAWRALALLQQELEDEGLAPMPRGAKPA